MFEAGQQNRLWSFIVVKNTLKEKFTRLSHDAVTCDADRSVPTAQCQSSLGDEVDSARVTYMLLCLAVIGWNSTAVIGADQLYVCSRNVAIHISSDHIIRQTITFLFKMVSRSSLLLCYFLGAKLSCLRLTKPKRLLKKAQVLAFGASPLSWFSFSFFSFFRIALRRLLLYFLITGILCLGISPLHIFCLLEKQLFFFFFFFSQLGL